MPTFAVTGATGGAGRVFCERAMAHGHHVRALVRSRAKAIALENVGVELVEGSLDNPASLDALCKSRDVLVHSAAHVGDWGKRETFFRVNVAGTRNAFEAAARQNVTRAVHISSVAVYGRPREGNITEARAPQLTGAMYEDSKIGAEQAAFDVGATSTLEVVALRPPVIFGPYDRAFVPRVLHLLKRRSAVLVDRGEGSLNCVDAHDLADGILRAATASGVRGEAFNLASMPVPTIAEIVKTIADVANLPPPRISLPFALALAAGVAIERGFAIAAPTRPPPLSRQMVMQMSLRVVYDSSKARHVLGWQGGKAPLEALARTVRDHFVK
jgi:nucleoside-diphosphate-sugar epimerase